MYPLVDWIGRIRGRPRALPVSGNVWRLGFTSFFTDISSEMVSAILPLYFVSYLRFSPLQFGVLDGIYQGAAVALLSLAAGICADRWRRQKEVAVAGYGFSAFGKLALLAVGSSVPLVAGTLVLDRIGKGIRTAPRDAIISLSSRPENLATAFAVHRGLDAGGAVFGPLAAFLLLRLAPGAFDLVLIVSFCVALIGFGLIGFLVEKPEKAMPSPTVSSLHETMQLWKRPGFHTLAASGAVLSLATASDGFVYLLLQRNTNSAASIFPLFAFVTAVFYVLFSLPFGKWADRRGGKQVFLGGYVLLLAIYVLLLNPGLGKGAQFATLGLFGAYYAATDGVLAALASRVIAPELRSSGLAMLNTVTSLCRFGSSVLFGWLWNAGTMRTPIWTFLFGLTGAIMVSIAILKIPRTHEQA